MAANHDTAVGWQAGPSRRGTLAIVENCLLTILACTWSIQHSNVPKLNEATKITLLRKLKWTMFALFFPEFLMAHAILEFMMAVENMKSLNRDRRLHGDSPWFFRWSKQWTTHKKDIEAKPRKSTFCFTASEPQEDLGGGDSRETGHPDQPSSSSADTREETDWTLTHCYFANMGGFYIQDNSASAGTPSNHIVTTSHFIQHWERLDIPPVTEKDLEDKSKKDYFAKTIAAIQIAQLVLSIIFRKTQDLAFSQLETLTLAFAVFGSLTYVCTWYKPQGVARPIRVFLRDKKNGIPHDIKRRSFDSLWKVIINSTAENTSQPLERVPNDNVPITKAHETHFIIYILAFLTAAFGAIHAVAWNFEFPTHIEQVVWRVATLVSATLPPVALIIIPLAQIIISWGRSDEFRNNCLHLMREFSWHTRDNQSIRDAIETLQMACGSPQESGPVRHFNEILGEGTESLGNKLLIYAENNERVRRELSENFLPKFARLVDILGGRSNSKREWDAARTNTYPRRSPFGWQVNTIVVYATTIAYCIARLAIVGISFSSLRLMPESVYQTTWTNLIPSIQ